MPFSMGRRVCPGETVAKAEIFLLTALLFQKYSFHAPKGETLNLEMKPGVAGNFPKLYKVVAKKR